MQNIGFNVNTQMPHYSGHVTIYRSILDKCLGKLVYRFYLNVRISHVMRERRESFYYIPVIRSSRSFVFSE